jgi:hypothetical protein
MGISTTPTIIASLAKKAYGHYLISQESLKKGPHPDWVKFGKEMTALELSLQKLIEATKQAAVK